MEAPELKPCPFCRNPMEWWGKDMFRHAEPINQKCPIALMAFTKSDIWNTRAPDPDLDAAVNEALEGVTPGPWRIGIDSDAYVDGDCDTWIAVGQDDYEAVALVIDERLQKDVNIGQTARFIAAARELVPLMRDRIEADAKRIAEVEADLVGAFEAAAAAVEELSKSPGTSWGQVKAHIRAMGDVGDRRAYNRVSTALTDAEAKLARMVEALGKIRELNMTGTDEDGHRWAHSDLIEQEIARALQEVGQ